VTGGVKVGTTTQWVTADELLSLPRGRFRYELVRGELITMSPAGSEHGAVVVNVTLLLGRYVKAGRLGVVFGAETGYKLATDPDTVLAPDISFIRRERIPASGLPQGYWPGAPDLAVEVLSPSDRAQKVHEKVKGWLAAGVQVVWTVDPTRRTVVVHRSPTEGVTLHEQDELDGEAVVPGFRCRVAEIFD
jgi:Uma2 family endonuclease